jgi:5-methyltetrahydrofolate--homocysteine methyltransferase
MTHQGRDPSAHDHAADRLRAALHARVLVLDGALATALHAGPIVTSTDDLTTREPRRVLDLHRAHAAAGADIITTNTFQSLTLGDAAPAIRARNEAAARLARRAIDETVAGGDHTSGKRTPARFVAGAIGPPPLPAPQPSRPLAAESASRLRAGYAEQAAGLLDGGVDLFLVETIYSLDLAESAVSGIRDAMARAGTSRPVLLSVTLGDRDGRTVGPLPFDAAVDRLLALRPFGLGVNCSFGRDGLPAAVATLAAREIACVSCHPSAGLPDAAGRHPDGPDDTAEALGRLADAGLLNIAGGCCGTTPAHVQAIAAAVRGLPPRRLRA